MITIEYIGNGLERVRSTENVKIRREDGAVFEDVIHPTGSAHMTFCTRLTWFWENEKNEL